MLIEAADEAGIPIPRFCYHKKLSVAANCRMCLVDVEKAAKPLPACATPVTDGMRVHTRSPKALEAQRGVMEFLLINHPLDCPICDQGGECELQDIAVGYGGGQSRYSENKRVVNDKNLGPLISTDMTRCIHCTRCVRFGEEIAGIKELGAVGRGEHMAIGTYVQQTVSSEMSGNVIDLCPVGALTSKPFRYAARSWEMNSRPAIAPHDCMGSNIDLHVRRNEVMRVVPRENEAINETWISDRDRFSYEGLKSQDRLQAPMIKVAGEWQKVTWDVALDFAVKGLLSITGGHGPHTLGALLSPSATTEEAYLLQKLVRGLGCNNVDHRLCQTDFSHDDNAPLYPSLGQPIAYLETVDAVLLIGSNVRKEQPIASHRLRKAALNGAKVMVVNPHDYPFNFPVAQKIVVDAALMVRELATVVKALAQLSRKPLPPGLDKLLVGINVDTVHTVIARNLIEAKRAAVVLGVGAMGHTALSSLNALAGVIAELTGASLGYLTVGANGAGAWLAGAVPHRGPVGAISTAGLNAREMALGEGLKGYLLLGIEPEHDSVLADALMAKLSRAEFNVVLSAYFTDAMAGYANVVLPIGPFSETSGTYVNVAGQWQSFAAAVTPQGNSRPAWKVLRVLGNLLNLNGFDYLSSEEVREELREQLGDRLANNMTAWRCPSSLSGSAGSAVELTPYAIDAIVRRAESLQQTPDAKGWLNR